MTPVVQFVEMQRGHVTAQAVIVLRCQFLDSRENAIKAIAQVVDNDHIVTSFEQLERSVGSDETETANDENKTTF